MPKKFDRQSAERRVTCALNLVPEFIQPGYRVGWFEVLGTSSKHRNKKTGRQSRYWYVVRCRDCGEQYEKSRGELNYIANYYKGERRCQHPGRDRNAITQLLKRCQDVGYTMGELVSIALLVDAGVDPVVVGQQYVIKANGKPLSPETCRRIAVDVPLRMRERAMTGKPMPTSAWYHNLKKSAQADDVEAQQKHMRSVRDVK